MRNSDGYEGITLVIMLIIIVVSLVLTPMACTDEKEAHRVLDLAGYTEIKTGGYSWFSCGKDTFATEFEAVNPNGKVATGTVCSNLFAKDSTIRF